MNLYHRLLIMLQCVCYQFTQDGSEKNEVRFNKLRFVGNVDFDALLADTGKFIQQVAGEMLNRKAVYLDHNVFRQLFDSVQEMCQIFQTSLDLLNISFVRLTGSLI